MQNFPKFSELPDDFSPVAVGQLRISNNNTPLKVLKIEAGRAHCQYANVDRESICDMPVEILQTKSKVFSLQ